MSLPTTANAFISYRRNVVQAVIRLADSYEGGRCSLVSIDEQPDETVMVFEVLPIRAWQQPDEQLRRIRCTIRPELETIE
jgi:hypothetical protein